LTLRKIMKAAENEQPFLLIKIQGK